ncbi:hypothetical protein K6L05_00270 [Salinicoccus roseus]|uniref:hypothetical protein n=1 Tax=Salinicoccus roseus TaxID=45670 RepID=UPI001CA6817D|nr:hypothetical protein [Salinicoccus roseus]MBY8908218.1 hypothetical protein [Salinicoccus roseus]
MDEKTITMYVYQLNEDGTPKIFDTTTNAQPQDDCLAFKISKKESLQIGKLKISVEGITPKIEYLEPFLDVVEGEFGYELVKPE